MQNTSGRWPSRRRGGTDAIRPDEGAEPGEGFLELMRVAQGCLEEAELMLGGSGGFGLELDGGDGGFRPDAFEMRLEHAEEDIRATGGLGNAEPAFEQVAGFLPELQDQSAHGFSRGFEPMFDGVHEPSEEEEQGFQRFDRGIELASLAVVFGRAHEAQGAGVAGGGGGPKRECLQSQAVRQLGLAEGLELRDGPDAPLGQQPCGVRTRFQRRHRQ
jgi:hypothetical protein